MKSGALEHPLATARRTTIIQSYCIYKIPNVIQPGGDTLNCAPFDVYAIRYARHSGRIAADNYLGKVDFHDAESDLDYYVWALRRGDEVYVVDTGFAEDAARQRGRELLMRPAQGLALIGIDAAQVRDVILTHLHYDHAGTLGDFPAAIPRAGRRAGLRHRALHVPWAVAPSVRRRGRGRVRAQGLCRPGQFSQRPDRPGARPFAAPGRRPHRRPADRARLDATRLGRAGFRCQPSVRQYRSRRALPRGLPRGRHAGGLPHRQAAG
ncbi:hypothetical protein CUR95_03715 [Bordetella bronchiseptica]|nr:hypothetical protein [Bordetella bronchiseptica]